MYQIFTQILNMSITASVVIVAVLLIRGVMHRLPKKYLYLLWGIVAIRLLCPIAVSSSVSLFNVTRLTREADLFSLTDVQERTADVTYRQPQLKENTSIQKSKNTSDGITVSEESLFTANNQAKKVSPFIQYGTVVWLTGMAGILLWNLYIALQMKRRLEKSVRYQGNIYECDNIPSPFVMGMVHPRIYIPFRLGDEEREYILRHEQYHIKRRDYIVKFGAFLLACVYWFHPLVWLSYFLMVRDMEMSCDEYVLQNVSADIRMSYSKSLLGFAVNQRGMAAGWLAFGETDTRKRVKNVLNFKKHGRWISVFAILLIAITGSVCLTNAKDSGKQSVKNKQSTNQEDKKGTNIQKIMKEEEEILETLGRYQAILAGGTAHGYKVVIVHKSVNELPKDADLDFGMYEGTFVIQTYKNNVKYAEYMLQLADTMYFPADGFDLVIKDYDGDGDVDDFSLGQGQTPDPMLGNFMNYFFFAVNEDGSIMQHTLSAENGKSLLTIPDAFSKNFECKDGRITYQALGENGVREETAEIVRITAKETHTLVFEDMNVTIRLPENKEWIQKLTASIDEEVGVVCYCDGVAETDVTLRFGKKGQKNVSEFSGDNSDKADEYWSFFKGNKEKLIQVRFYALKNSMTTAVLSWVDNGMQFYLYADFSDLASSQNSVDTNWPVLAKTAAYIAENSTINR